MAQLNCVVVTPEETALEQTASFIVLPLFDGEIGIGPGHSPLIGRLGFGEMRLNDGNNVSRYYVDGGFVQVADNTVSVLTGRAIPAGEVNVDAARKQLEQAKQKPSNTPELMEIRDRLVNQARSQIQVGQRAV